MGHDRITKQKCLVAMVTDKMEKLQNGKSGNCGAENIEQL